MIPSRKGWALGTTGFLALLCVMGCTTPFYRPPLRTNAHAEALSHFSLGILAEANEDSVAALDHLQAAIRIDPYAENIYAPAIAIALKLERFEDALRLANQLNKKHPNTQDSLLLLAQVYALTDQAVVAETLFTKTVSAFPDEPESHLSLARFFLSQDRASAATHTLESALQKHGENVEILQLLGGLRIESASQSLDDPAAHEKISEGLHLLEKALEIDGSNPKRWQQVGYILLSIQQPERALVALKMARSHLPEDPNLARQVMELSIQTGVYEEALALSETLPEETGVEAEAWLQYLVENTPSEHQGRLIEYLKEQLTQDPPPVFYYTQLGVLYLDNNRMAEAATCLLDALTIYPNDARLRTVLGYLHLQEENFGEAYTEFDYVRKNTPETDWIKNPFFTFNFMIAAQKSDHFEDAVSTLVSTYTNGPVLLNQYMHSLLTGQSPVSTSAAITLLEAFHQQRPNAMEALYYLSVLQTEEKQYTVALENVRQFEVLAKSQGDTNRLDGFFYFQYATLHERTGQFEEAEKYFFQAIEMGDEVTVSSAQNYLAYMWAERGEKLEHGLGLIEQALATDPDNAAFMDTRGWIYYMQGRYPEALDQLKIARELFNGDSTIWEHLGDTYLKLGNPTAAVEHWEKALDLSPEAEHLNQRIKENTPQSTQPCVFSSTSENTRSPNTEKPVL